MSDYHRVGSLEWPVSPDQLAGINDEIDRIYNALNAVVPGGYTIGDLLYADSINSLAKLPDVAAGSYLRSGGVGVAPLWSTLVLPDAVTKGSVVFGSATNTYGQDNAKFFWDDTNFRLGIGTATPARNLDVIGTMATTGASMGLLGTAGSESLFVFNSTAGATTFAAKTDGTLTLNGLNSFSSSIGLSINMAAGGAWTPMVVTSNGGSTGDVFVISALKRVGIGVSSPGALLSIVGAGAVPSALTGSVFQATVNQATFGAPTIARFENNSTNAATAIALDVLCGDTAGSFVYGRIEANSPNHASPYVLMGSGSVHDLILTTGGGEILHFKASAPYFIGFGGITASFPASKRETVNWSFRLGDDSAYTGIIASKLYAGGTNVWWQASGTTKLQAQNGSGYATLDVGPIQINATTGLTNKNIYLTGTLNSATPASFYVDVALTGLTGGTSQAFYLAPSFTLAGNSTSVAVLQIPATTVTLAGFTVTNATSLYIENTPTNGTNKRSIWVAAGLSQFDGIVQTNALQVNGSNALTNKSIYLTGTINHSSPAAFYIDSALTGITGGLAQGVFLNPSFSLAGNSTTAAVLQIPVATVTLNAFTLTNASSLQIDGAPTNGTNKRSLWVGAGLSQFDGSVFLGAKMTAYNAVTTAGWGVPAVYGSGRSTAQAAAVSSVATYTVGAADGSFDVAANVLVTTATSHAFTAQVAYTDEGNTARTLTLSFTLVAGGTLVTSIANANGAVPYMGIPQRIRCKAATTITIKTAGTFTTVVYNVEGAIIQIA